MGWWKKFKSLKPRYRFLIIVATVFIVFWVIPGILTKGRWMIYVDRPYEGKIIDMETKQPIERAVVFARYFVNRLAPGDVVTAYIIVKEAVTDKYGKFELPYFFRIGFCPLDILEEEPNVIIFKSEYPFINTTRDPSSDLKKIDKYMPSHESITIEIKRLKTIDERRKHLEYFPGDGKYNNNSYILFRLYNQERVKLGLAPLPSKQ